MGWTVHFESTTDEPVGDEQVGALVSGLADHGGTVTSATRRFGATFSVDDDLCAAEVIRRGEELYRTAARNAHLPASTIVRAEAITWSEHDEALDQPAYPEPVRIAEIAEMLGISRQRASALQVRDGFPRPLTVLAAGPVWPKPWLTTFVERWDRKPGRPRKARPSSPNWR